MPPCTPRHSRSEGCRRLKAIASVPGAARQPQLLEPLQREPDRRRVRPHVRSQPSIEPVEFPTLLARRVGEPVGLSASEIPPAGRQVELRHAPRRSAILARQRAQKPPAAAAIGWLGRHEPNSVVHGIAARHVGELQPCRLRIDQVGLVADPRMWLGAFVGPLPRASRRQSGRHHQPDPQCLHCSERPTGQMVLPWLPRLAAAQCPRGHPTVSRILGLQSDDADPTFAH